MFQVSCATEDHRNSKSHSRIKTPHSNLLLLEQFEENQLYRDDGEAEATRSGPVATSGHTQKTPRKPGWVDGVRVGRRKEDGELILILMLATTYSGLGFQAEGIQSLLLAPIYEGLSDEAMGLPSLLHSIVFIWIITSSCFIIGYGQDGILNVLDFGAYGDGVVDDTQAFINAWTKLCGTGQILKIPTGKTFVVKPFELVGPCKFGNIVIQIDGNIVAPSTIQGWENVCKLRCWLCFRNVNGLIIKGMGLINGKGSIWWNQKTQNINETDLSCGAPSAMHFHNCNDLQLYGFTSRDSPREHIFIHSSNRVHISNIHLNAPENSPNTDGIDISLSSQVTIQDSFIKTGDDCIAIKGGSSFVNVTHVTCGPGHGFSVGSLGQDPTIADEVEQIYFQNCICEKTMNCARIKTWMGGSGYAREIFFRRMTLIESKNPILIDQHYSYSAKYPTKNGAVKVSAITFIDFSGSSLSEQAITLNCSNLGCSNILIDHVILKTATGKPLWSLCNKASGIARFTEPHVPCLSSKQSPSPMIAPI
ncbi:probable polygalacturonase At3g15720 [Argentina anserina]|uniref:probable polygalacturonase At3g15720 n=1 Tax=Argentina anserina TaxID=57926 RepID=UPI00217620ED|nr:probable polygalacturonase At3g15720 [Potentilla anserina]